MWWRTVAEASGVRGWRRMVVEVWGVRVWRRMVAEVWACVGGGATGVAQRSDAAPSSNEMRRRPALSLRTTGTLPRARYTEVA